MLYRTPEEFFFRIHHVRPRFKLDVESVLLFVCQRISNLEKQPSSLYDAELYKMIRSYPGNYEKAPKTIHNWRTEISALFGLETLSSVKRMGSQGLSEFGLIDQKLNNGTLLNNW